MMKRRNVYGLRTINLGEGAIVAEEATVVKDQPGTTTMPLEVNNPPVNKNAVAPAPALTPKVPMGLYLTVAAVILVGWLVSEEA